MRSMIAKIKSFGEKPISEKLFYILFLMIPFFYLLERIVCSVYDSDMYFLIATGREILKNGIPHTNVWTINKGQGIVIQQWLYAVILALVDKAGYAGFSIFITFQFAIFTGLWLYFFSLRNISKRLSLLSLVMFSMPAQDYLFSIRPQLVTMILILASCICIEKFRQTWKGVWLVGLPIMMCLEMQLHLSMWIIHFMVIMAYFVPAFYFKPFDKTIEDDSLFIHLKEHKKAIVEFIVAIIAMIGTLFINPYGIRGAMYLIYSFKSHAFDYVPVLEVNPTTFISPQGATILLCIVLFLVAWKLGHLRSTTINMTIGFCFMMMIVVRNNTCCIFVMAFTARDILASLNNKTVSIDWKKDLKVSIVPVMLFADLIFVTNFLSSCENVFAGKNGTETNLPAIVNIIKQDYNTNMHIFTGFNDGAYFEYMGFKNLYIDARPELYVSAFTGDKDILRDYSKYCVYGYDVRLASMSKSSIKAGQPVSNANITAWFNSYDFDYVIVSPMAETFLSAYMLQRDDYEMIDAVSDDYHILYRKTKLHECQNLLNCR